MMKWTKHIKDESGASAIIVALMLVVLLGAAALAMDLGSAYSTGAKVQNTCDAAALAAAKELPNRCSTESVAKQFVKENGINPKYAKITINDSSSRVEVSINKKVNTDSPKFLVLILLLYKREQLQARKPFLLWKPTKNLTIFLIIFFFRAVQTIWFSIQAVWVFTVRFMEMVT